MQRFENSPSHPAIGLHYALALLLGMACLSQAHAQRQPADRTPYIKTRLGASVYAGDRNGGPSDLFSAFSPGPGVGFEIGYGDRLGSLGGDLGLFFLAGRYPRIRDNTLPAQGDVPAVSEGELNAWRHTLGLVGTLGLLPNAAVNPYLQLGAGTTLGVSRDGVRAAFSPIGGIGVEIPYTNQVRFFVEAVGVLAFPDTGIDEAEDVDDSRLDGLGFYGGGIRIDLSTPVRPINIRGIDGPTMLRAGQRVSYRAQVESGSKTTDYRWTFGDGSMQEGLLVQQSFPEPGTYTVTFTASNERTTTSESITVVVTPPARPARITGLDAPSAPVAQEPASFRAQVESDGEATCRWAFGDGSTATGCETSHAYPEPGSYEATLVVSNAAGSSERRIALDVRPRSPLSAGPPADSPEETSLTCNDVVEFNAVFFEDHTATLSAEGRDALAENVDVLTQCPELRVEITGRAASREGASSSLAAARAEALKDYYLSQGLSQERIAAVKTRVAAGKKVSKDGAAYRRADSVPVGPADTAARRSTLHPE